MNRIHTESLFLQRREIADDVLREKKPSAISSIVVAAYIAFACLWVGVMLSVYFLFADQKPRLLELQRWVLKCCTLLKIERTAFVENLARIDQDR